MHLVSVEDRFVNSHTYKKFQFMLGLPTVSNMNSEHLSNLQLQVPLDDSWCWKIIFTLIFGTFILHRFRSHFIIIYNFDDIYWLTNLKISFQNFFRPFLGIIRNFFFLFPNKFFHTNSWYASWPSIFIGIKSWCIKGRSKVRISCPVQCFVTCTPKFERQF